MQMPLPACLAALQSPIFTQIWLQNTLSVWLPNLMLAAAGIILLLGGILRNIPAESEDAAILDGCGFWRTLIHLVVPQLGPALLCALAVLILAGWEDVMAPKFVELPPQVTALTASRPGNPTLQFLSPSVFIGHTPVDAGAAAAVFMLAASVAVAFIYLLMRYLRLGRFTQPPQ
jgi:ABC-type glycerol-3-phosphate transport system permease component